jgi:hypothetical protein
MISLKKVIVHLKYSPIKTSQVMGHYLQAHHECLQLHLYTIKAVSRQLLALPQ